MKTDLLFRSKTDGIEDRSEAPAPTPRSEWIEDAERIMKGQTMRLPEMEHLRALLDEIEDYRRLVDRCTPAGARR